MPDQNVGQKDASLNLEDELILKAKIGDRDALSAIYDSYAMRLYRYAYSRIGNPDDAQDILAQTFISMIEALPNYQHRGYFTAWLFRIAGNKVMDFFRRNHEQLQDEASQANTAFDETLEQVIQVQAIQSLRHTIRLLGEDEQELLRLRFVVDLSYVEIARLLGRKEDAVRKSVKRILERLHTQMEVDHG